MFYRITDTSTGERLKRGKRRRRGLSQEEKEGKDGYGEKQGWEKTGVQKDWHGKRLGREKTGTGRPGCEDRDGKRPGWEDRDVKTQGWENTGLGKDGNGEGQGWGRTGV